MPTKPTDSLARTVEFKTATVHLLGDYAGAIEVPVFVGLGNPLHAELDDLCLSVEGEERPLRPVRREYFAGQLRLMFFSNHIRLTRELPTSIQICWEHTLGEDSPGMELVFQAASDAWESRN
jgi:hypothetical protein